jgi:hypothetical protein
VQDSAAVLAAPWLILKEGVQITPNQLTWRTRPPEVDQIDIVWLLQPAVMRESRIPLSRLIVTITGHR